MSLSYRNGFPGTSGACQGFRLAADPKVTDEVTVCGKVIDHPNLRAAFLASGHGQCVLRIVSVLRLHNFRRNRFCEGDRAVFCRNVFLKLGNDGYITKYKRPLTVIIQRGRIHPAGYIEGAADNRDIVCVLHLQPFIIEVNCQDAVLYGNRANYFAIFICHIAVLRGVEKKLR